MYLAIKVIPILKINPPNHTTTSLLYNTPQHSCHLSTTYLYNLTSK